MHDDDNQGASSPGNKKRLAIIATHPVQYNSPLYRALTASTRIEPRVFYTWSQTASGQQYDPGFGIDVKWDIPLLEGYEHEFVANIARRPGSDHFFGIRTPTLISKVLAWQPNAVLIYGWNYEAHLRAMLALKGRVPIFLRGDSTVLDPISPVRAFARWMLLSWVYRHIDVALAVGENNREYFEWCGVARSSICFAPHSVDNDRFSDADREHEMRAQAWRRELGIPDDAVTLVFAGKLVPKKDPLLLLDAFLQANAHAHLVIVGNGVLEEVARARAQGHLNVHFLPFQNQSVMPTVYRLGDIFILPSRGPGETWGLALNEAMASSRAVIAGNRVGAARDLIAHADHGWLFESGNLESLRDVLERALALERSVLKVMGKAARRRIDGWSTQAAADGISEAIARFA